LPLIVDRSLKHILMGAISCFRKSDLVATAVERGGFSGTRVDIRRLGWKRRQEEANEEAAAREGYRGIRVWPRKRRRKEKGL